MEASRVEASREGMAVEPVRCNLCDVDDCDPIAVGEDFEYRTSAEVFRAVRCRRCGLVYLNPRPVAAERGRMYPDHYHAYEFSSGRFGLVHAVRRRLEARRLLRWCRGLPEDARILDVGCGDGFHLRLLRDFGRPGWRLEGVDSSPRAVAAAIRAGLVAHLGTLQTAPVPRNAYDLVLHLMTLEHVDDPVGVLASIRDVLRPGGRCVVVTDNVDSPDFALFGGRHWGGYHFPRHFHLFGPKTLRLAADKAGFEVEALRTMVSPVNWTYSVRNACADLGAPPWLVERFSLQAPAALAAFTVFDGLHAAAGRGAILNAVLRRPAAGFSRTVHQKA
jgi:SAM-dependent methyltransferase